MPDEPLDVFYDGACDLCRAAAESWRQSDGQGRLSLHPLQAELPDDAPDRGQLAAVIHVRSASGWQGGARALLAIYRRLPRGRLVACLLRLGIALGIADPIYRLVARHRTHLPAVLHPRKRDS